jgi:Sigma-70 region 3
LTILAWIAKASYSSGRGRSKSKPAMINKIVRTSRQMLSEIGREPTPEELNGGPP